MRAPAETTGGGLPYAIAAYVIWGLAPIYFKLLEFIPALDVVAYRIIWSVPLCLLIVAARHQGPQLRAALTNSRVLATLAVTALLIGTNWLIFIHAINDGHIIATSLGYYLNPLVNVLLATLFLGERLGSWGKAAVVVAGVGVSLLLVDALDTLWISLSLAFSFATYGLLRKTAAVGALPGLTIETGLLLPPALIFAVWTFADDPSAPMLREVGPTLLVMAAGVITTVPLLMFATAARRMDYITIGFIQYLAPSISFLLGLFAYGETLSTTKLLCFLCIWASVALFSVGAWRGRAAAG